jgi:hypothetical protein
MSASGDVVGPHLEQPSYLRSEASEQLELGHKPSKTMDSGEEQVVMAVEVLTLVRDHSLQLARRQH